MQAAERMRDDMLSSLSHELRTPLTTIMGFAEVLRSHADALSPEVFRDMLERLVEKGMQLEMIVSGLLDLTAIRGRSEPERIAVYELRDLAEQAVLRRSPTHLSLRQVAVEGDAGLVHTDGGAVLAVVEELLENVAKHTPRPSSVHVVVTGDEAEVAVEVRDDGPAGATSSRPTVATRHRSAPSMPSATRPWSPRAAAVVRRPAS
jgi:K+-sensing histidine kinase KdpD